jgi:hypothetical protein
MAAIASGHAHEYLPLTGQSVGAVKDVLPAADILRQVVAEAVAALTRLLNPQLTARASCFASMPTTRNVPPSVT